MRLMALWLNPAAFAIDRVLQCVASRGVLPSVRARVAPSVRFRRETHRSETSRVSAPLVHPALRPVFCFSRQRFFCLTTLTDTPPLRDHHRRMLFDAPRLVAWMPSFVKAPARRWHRTHVLRRGLARLQGVIARDGAAPVALLNDLVYGWGNEGWSGRADYLSEVVLQAQRTLGPVLECGAGLSTIVLGLVAEHRLFDAWSLEEEPSWAARVQHELDRLRIRRARVLFSPLAGRGDYDWYGVLPPEDVFRLVLCDGPGPRCRGLRYGLLPVMRDRLAPNATIILDDATTDCARETEAWQNEGLELISLAGGERVYATFRTPAAP